MHPLIYKRTQNSILVNSIFIISILLILFPIIKSGNTSETRILIIIMLFILFIWLLVYRLTIKINNNSIIAIFGIGLLKRKVKISDIDFSTIEIKKPSILTGVGIRLTPNGWLWNVKFGKAIYFKSKSGKTFFVGTDEPEIIVEKLKEALNTKKNINSL